MFKSEENCSQRLCLANVGGVSFYKKRALLCESQLTARLLSAAANNSPVMDQLKVKDRILENMSLSVKKVSSNSV